MSNELLRVALTVELAEPIPALGCCAKRRQAPLLQFSHDCFGRHLVYLRLLFGHLAIFLQLRFT